MRNMKNPPKKLPGRARILCRNPYPRTGTSSGIYKCPGRGQESIQNSQNFRVWVRKAGRTHRTCRVLAKALAQKTVLATEHFTKNVPVPPVTVREAGKTCSTIGYGCISLTHHFSVLSGKGMADVQKTARLCRYFMSPCSGYGCGGLTEHAAPSGAGMVSSQNLQNHRVYG